MRDVFAERKYMYYYFIHHPALLPHSELDLLYRLSVATNRYSIIVVRKIDDPKNDRDDTREVRSARLLGTNGGIAY